MLDFIFNGNIGYGDDIMQDFPLCMKQHTRNKWNPK